MFGWARRVLAGFGVAALLLTAASGAVAGEDPLPPGLTRLAGDNRYDTSSAIAATSFTAPVEAVFIATGADYPDALAAGPAASRFGGPVLLVKSDNIPSSVRTQLTRLKPQTIYVLGGKDVVSGGVFEGLKAYAGSVERLNGQNRYATAVEVSREGWDDSATVFLASGAGFADALSGGAAAAARQAPLLLTPSGNLASVTRDELVRLSPGRVIVLGGRLAVSDSVASSVKEALPSASVARVAGENRYATSAQIAREMWPERATSALFATGADFADALSGTPAAAVNDGPLLLTKQDCLPKVVYGIRADFGLTTTGILGGSKAVSTAGATQECGTYRYSGSGDEVLKITKPSGASQPAIITATHKGDGHFAIWSLDKNLENNDLLVNTIGDYTGTTLLDPAQFGEAVSSTHLDISANGPWTIAIQAVGAARAMSSNKTTGAGDDVLRWTGKAVTARITHNGSGYFGVWAREANGDYHDLLVSDVGEYNGTVVVPGGTRLVTIEGDGVWSIDVQ